MDGENAVTILAEGAVALQGQRNLKDARGISDEAIDGIYGVAHELYAGGKYAEALRGFRLLCLYDHENPKHWMGLGYCRQMLADYMGAATALSYSTLYLDDHDWELYLNLARCLIMLGRKGTATEYIDAILASSSAGTDIQNEAKSLQIRLASDTTEVNVDG
jgi:Flp pilus assembly protein TadD